MNQPEHSEPPAGMGAAPTVEGISALTLATRDLARAGHVAGGQVDRADALDHRVNAHVFWYPGFHGFLAMPARVLWTCPGQSLPVLRVVL